MIEPTTSEWAEAAARAIERSRARRQPPTLREKLEVLAGGLAIPLGFLALYVIAGILTGGPR